MTCFKNFVFFFLLLLLFCSPIHYLLGDAKGWGWRNFDPGPKISNMRLTMKRFVTVMYYQTNQGTYPLFYWNQLFSLYWYISLIIACRQESVILRTFFGFSSLVGSISSKDWWWKQQRQISKPILVLVQAQWFVTINS